MMSEQSGFGSGWDAFQRGEGILSNPFEDWRFEQFRDGWKAAQRVASRREAECVGK